jgi:hypothetical protein
MKRCEVNVAHTKIREINPQLQTRHANNAKWIKNIADGEKMGEIDHTCDEQWYVHAIQREECSERK